MADLPPRCAQVGGVDREAVAQRLGACAQLLKLFNESLLLMDEVDVLLHPLRSELNFIIGPRVDLDLSSSRKLRTSLLVLSRAFYYREIMPLLVQWTLLYWSPTNPRVTCQPTYSRSIFRAETRRNSCALSHPCSRYLVISLCDVRSGVGRRDRFVSCDCRSTSSF